MPACNKPVLEPMMTQIFVACSSPSHYLNQCWNDVNWIRRNEFQWHFNQNSYILIKENAFENSISKISSMVSRPQRVKRHKTAPAFHSPSLITLLKYKEQMKPLSYVVYDMTWLFITGRHIGQGYEKFGYSPGALSLRWINFNPSK